MVADGSLPLELGADLEAVIEVRFVLVAGADHKERVIEGVPGGGSSRWHIFDQEGDQGAEHRQDPRKCDDMADYEPVEKKLGFRRRIRGPPVILHGRKDLYVIFCIVNILIKDLCGDPPK